MKVNCIQCGEEIEDSEASFSQQIGKEFEPTYVCQKCQPPNKENANASALAWLKTIHGEHPNT